MKAFIMLLLAVAMAGWLGVPDGNAQPTLYIAASEKLLEPSCQNCFFPGASSLHRVNPQTGRATPVGAIGFDAVGGMAFHPLTGILYAVGQRAGTTSFITPGPHVLITIDPATGVGTEIGLFTAPLGCPFPGCRVDDLAFRPDGVLYGMVSEFLVTIDLGTGAGTQVAAPPFDGVPANCCDSLTFSADGSVLFGRGFEANFFILDPATGATIDGRGRLVEVEAGTLGNDPTLTFEVTRLDALDTEPGTGRLWGVTDDAVGCAAACLLTIEPTPDPILDMFVGTRVAFILDASGFSGQLGFVLALAWSPGAANTPAGANVVVQVAPATLTFEMVTQAGTTTVTTSPTGPPPPSGFSLGTPPTYFEVSTTALFSGFVNVCIQYAGIAFGNENSLRLLHFDGAVFADVTTSLNTATNVICGRSATLSPFVVVERAQSVAEMIVDLIEAIRGRELPAALEARLVVALEGALVNPRQVSLTCGALQRFIGLVRFAQAIGRIPADRATQLIDDAQAIRAALGC